MESIQSLTPFYVLMVPLAAIPLIAVSGRWPNLRETWTILAAVCMFVLTAGMLPQVLAGNSFEYHLVSMFQGVDIAFRVDPLGICFAVTASFLWIIVSFYSIGYMRSLHEHAQTRFYLCFAIALLAVAGAAFAANLVTLLIFYELLTLSTYPLVVHHEDEEAIKGARTYMIYLLGTSILFNLPAIFMTYVYAHTLEFTAGGILAGKASTAMITGIFVLFIAGTGKAALMPFHSWLPAAMVAPTPVSALLHAVAVVKAGVFTITRVVLFVFGADLLSNIGLGTILAYVAAFTIIVASVIALRQDNLKRRLAYSTVGQLSYIILGVSLLNLQGITGGIVHISMHAFGKITLFMCAGAILTASGKKKISDMKGIGKKMPVTMIAFFIGSLSVIGLPPCGGFLSKWYLALGCIEAEHIPLLVVLLTSSFLNAAYFLPIVYQAFYGKPADDDAYYQAEGIQEGPVFSVAALGVTAIASMALFFYPQPFMQLAGMVGRQMFGG